MCHVCLQFQRALKFGAKVLHFFAVCWSSTTNNYGDRMIFLTRSSEMPYSAAILA